ncbi:MAG: 2,3-bisphosphoglycerate-independent phosphoglycerate mutase [Actinomycetota bacterium]
MTDLVPNLVRPGKNKIVLLVLDGLGGLRTPERGSEIAEANTPNLDRLATEGSSGVHTVVAPGITPGSGAGHMALFGYDPTTYLLGRGALSAAGVAFDLKPGDIAARVNFCTLDDAGNVADRRAGRIPTETNERLCRTITENVELPRGVQAFLTTEREHRALLVLRGPHLNALIKDTDPQEEGVAPQPPTPVAPEATSTAAVVEAFLDQVRLLLKDEQANFLLLRGFDTHRELPSFRERYQLEARGIAAYPMYLGLARLVGMDTAPAKAHWGEEIAELEASWDDYDYFFLHLKGTDSAGEDGDFERKCAAIEEVDATVERIRALGPGVLCVTGDHSTPAPLKRHSWHPVPFVMWGPTVGVDPVTKFDEESARAGLFGQQLAKDLMTFMLAAAGRLRTYGA